MFWNMYFFEVLSWMDRFPLDQSICDDSDAKLKYHRTIGRRKTGPNETLCFLVRNCRGCKLSSPAQSNKQGRCEEKKLFSSVRNNSAFVNKWFSPLSLMQFKPQTHSNDVSFFSLGDAIVSNEKKELLLKKLTPDVFLFPAAILVHQNGTPIWRPHTKLYKGAWDDSANNSETVGHKDMRLGQTVYKLVFYNISFSCLLPLDGFQFIFLLRDSENDLYGNR